MTSKKTGKITEDICFSIKKQLPVKIYLGYGLGHMLNDVCAAMWFSYLIVFFHLVLKFSNVQAGLLLLVGQVADAIATPFVGYNSDKNHNWWIYRFGKRKIWYFFGTAFVIFTFPFIFSPCINCHTLPKSHQMFYYSAFIILFQFGWAAVQVAHMALIPEITTNVHQRTKLAAIRNGATVVASVIVYLSMWSILHLSGGSKTKIGPEHQEKFQHVAWGLMVFGIICSIAFYSIIKEPKVVSSSSEDYTKPLSFKELFRNKNLYFVATVYMSSRLFINLTQVFISMYLAESLNMVASALALVPLAIYISSFLASFPVGSITKIFGRKLTYSLGSLIGMVAYIWIHWGEGHNYTTYYIFIVSAILGSSSTIVLVSSLDITTDLIGSKTNRGALIYGIMSFADKLSNGFAVEVIQDLHKDTSDTIFYRDVLSYACGGALILGTLAVMAISYKSKIEETVDMSSETINTIA